MNGQTISELELQRAVLSARAERKRVQWRAMSFSAISIRLGKEIKDLDQRVGDYDSLIRVAKEAT